MAIETARVVALLAIVALLVVAWAPAPVAARLREGECSVCIGTLQKVIDNVPLEGRTPDVVEVELKNFCKKATGKENRFCYYIGATDDAASSIVKDVVSPLANSVPHNLICERLKKRDPQICELTYDVEIDWKTVDLNKLRVKDLRKIAEKINVPCQGCTEKSEFIRVINDARSKKDL